MKGQILYSVFMVIGIVAAFIVSRKLTFENYNALSSTDRTRVLLGLVPGVIVGAKLPVLLSYGFHLSFIISGKSIFGALMGAYIGINIVKYFYGMKGNYGDRFVIPLCVAVAFGKIGCYLNGCCGGIETDFILNIANHCGVSVHPTQLYSSVFHVIFAMVFYFLYRKKYLLTMHFVLYMIFYSIFRFSIEFIRTEPPIVLGFTVYQVMALISLLYFGPVLFIRLNRMRNG